jgi:hypothetical protein
MILGLAVLTVELLMNCIMILAMYIQSLFVIVLVWTWITEYLKWIWTILNNLFQPRTSEQFTRDPSNEAAWATPQHSRTSRSPLVNTLTHLWLYQSWSITFWRCIKMMFVTVSLLSFFQWQNIGDTRTNMWAFGYEHLRTNQRYVVVHHWPSLLCNPNLSLLLMSSKHLGIYRTWSGNAHCRFIPGWKQF